MPSNHNTNRLVKSAVIVNTEKGPLSWAGANGCATRGGPLDEQVPLLLDSV
jgi:hypothetical protein